MSREPVRRVARLLAPLALAAAVIGGAAGPAVAAAPPGQGTAKQAEAPRDRSADPARVVTLQGTRMVVHSARDASGAEVTLRLATRRGIEVMERGKLLTEGTVLGPGTGPLTVTVLTDRGVKSLTLLPDEGLTLDAWGNPVIPGSQYFTDGDSGTNTQYQLGCRCTCSNGTQTNSNYEVVCNNNGSWCTCSDFNGAQCRLGNNQPPVWGTASGCERALIPIRRDDDGGGGGLEPR